MSPLHHDHQPPSAIKQIVYKMLSAARLIKSKWLIILLASILGGGAFFCYAIFKKPIYIAVSSFVLEESGTSSGLGQYASLASMAGITMGNGGGVFEGDNIIELYRSRSMIKNTLLTPIEVSGKKILLIDLYADFNFLNRFREQKDAPQITFTSDPKNFTRKQDSVINKVTDAINDELLDVRKLDKKINVIIVEVKTPNEFFSKAFNQTLVANVNRFYTETKTKRSTQNLNILQKQSDSVRNLLDRFLGAAAYSIDAVPNLNPYKTKLRVPTQQKQIDIQATSTLYAEIAKNLELSKISLQQESPLIQIIDKPIFPLAVEKASKIKAFLTGAFFAAAISVCVIVSRKMIGILLHPDSHL